MFSTIPFAVLAVASAITGVQGHGYIAQGVFGGVTYPAWDPNTDPYTSPATQRIFRKIPNDGPITDVTSADLACNTGGNTGAALVAKVAAGSEVTITMNRWPDDHKGPIFQYMASCGGDCKTFDATQAKWFKIYEDGYVNGVWASDKLIKNGLSVTTTIPADLAPGQYLFRNELVALHAAHEPQFYPECAQLEVTGSGNLKATAKELVSIPGVYDTSDDFFTTDIWSDSFKSFALPSPVIASLASNGGSTGSTPQASSPSTASSASATAQSASSSPVAATGAGSSASPSATLASPTPSGTGMCRRRTKRRSNIAARHRASVAKRHH